MIDERAICTAYRAYIDEQVAKREKLDPRSCFEAGFKAALPLLIGEGWRPIGELHAVVGDRIWAFLPGGEQLVLRLSDDFRSEDAPQWVDIEGAVCFPTHWMPLPAAPDFRAATEEAAPLSPDQRSA